MLKPIFLFIYFFTFSFFSAQNEQLALDEIISRNRITKSDTFIKSTISIYEKKDLEKSISFVLYDYYHCDGNKSNKIIETEKFKFDFEDLPISYENAKTQNKINKPILNLEKKFSKANKKNIVTVFESIKVSDSDYLTRINYSDKTKNYITTNFYVHTKNSKVIDVCEQVIEF